jgi:hypothetical protein
MPKNSSIHYPWLAAGVLVDMMDRIFDVQGVKSRPQKPESDNRTWVGGKPC